MNNATFASEESALEFMERVTSLASSLYASGDYGDFDRNRGITALLKAMKRSIRRIVIRDFYPSIDWASADAKSATEIKTTCLAGCIKYDDGSKKWETFQFDGSRFFCPVCGLEHIYNADWGFVYQAEGRQKSERSLNVSCPQCGHEHILGATVSGIDGMPCFKCPKCESEFLSINDGTRRR